MKSVVFFVFLFLSTLVQSQVSYNVDSLALWRDPYKGSNGMENVYNEVWGFAKDGREYGVLGARDGAYIIDVTNVRKPELIEFLPGRHKFGTNRDYHDYNDYLYMVCDQGESSLQIADLRYLPDSVPIVYDSDDLIIRCHNLFIDTITETLYACGVTIPDTTSGKRVDMQIYDISKSYLPELLLTFDDDKDEFHDVYVKNDTAIGNRGRSGLFFYDFSDLSDPDPRITNEIDFYPDQGYNHAGYTNVAGDYYFFSDETHGMDLKSVRLNDYDEPQVINLFNAGRNKEQIVAHNLLVRDSLLFVSYYHEGLQIFDISDPETPVKSGHYQTFTNTIVLNPGDPPVKDYSGFNGAWGVYPYLPSGYILVSDRAKGLFIFNIEDIDGNNHPELLPRKTIFPNPAGSYIDIVYPASEILEIEIYDVNGRLVERSSYIEEVKRISRYNFIQPLNTGLYILKVQARNETFVEKFVKQ